MHNKYIVSLACSILVLLFALNGCGKDEKLVGDRSGNNNSATNAVEKTSDSSASKIKSKSGDSTIIIVNATDSVFKNIIVHCSGDSTYLINALPIRKIDRRGFTKYFRVEKIFMEAADRKPATEGPIPRQQSDRFRKVGDTTGPYFYLQWLDDNRVVIIMEENGQIGTSPKTN